MHVSDISEIVLPPGFDADAFLPLMYELQDARHDGSRERRGTLWKASYHLVEKLLGGDLEVERVSTALDESIEECEGEHRYVGIAVVDKTHDEHGGLAGSGGGPRHVSDSVRCKHDAKRTCSPFSA